MPLINTIREIHDKMTYHGTTHDTYHIHILYASYHHSPLPANDMMPGMTAYQDDAYNVTYTTDGQAL